MTGSRGHGLILLGVVAAIAAATSAGAEVRPASKVRTARSSERAVVARATLRATPSPQRAYAREIAAASARYAVPERLIWAVIRVESGFDHRAVSPKGARGLMQLMPETAAILGVRDPFDPRQNIHAGTRHLRAMIERFHHDLRLAVAAYNAGVGPVVRHRGVPPYPETREYVTQVLRFYGTPLEDTPVERVAARGDGVRRIVQPGGTVLYTNVAFGGLGALSR
jgi:soluble lytic murein transglycosylase-like protein